jgi:hypothetical protein
MWRCDPNNKNSCTDLNKAGSAINTLTLGRGYIYAGLNSGTMWRCDPNNKNSCTDFNRLGSGINSIIQSICP